MYAINVAIVRHASLQSNEVRADGPPLKDVPFVHIECILGVSTVSSGTKARMGLPCTL